MISAAHAQTFLAEAAGVATDPVQPLVNLLNFAGFVAVLATPGIVALVRNHPARLPILFFGFFFGMTGLVWVVTLWRAFETPAGANCRPLGMVAGLGLLASGPGALALALGLDMWL